MRIRKKRLPPVVIDPKDIRGSVEPVLGSCSLCHTVKQCRSYISSKGFAFACDGCVSKYGKKAVK